MGGDQCDDERKQGTFEKGDVKVSAKITVNGASTSFWVAKVCI
jgi:hypothetical protein